MECRPLLFLLALCFLVSAADVQEESYKALLEGIFDTLTEIQLDVKKEDRIREVAKLLRIDAKLEEINQKVRGINPPNENSNLNIDSRNMKLGNLENVIQDIQIAYSQLNKKINKLEEEERSNKDDTNSKIQKLSNIISTVHDFSKTQQSHFEPSDPQQVERSGYGIDMSEFIIANLEEIERKFKEGLRNLKDDVKRNLNFIKSLAGSTSRCSNSNGRGLLEASESISRGQTFPNPNTNQDSTNRALRNMKNTLSLTEKEIKDEIGNNIESIDIKLFEISNYLRTCERPNRGSSEPSRRETEVIDAPEQDISHHICSNASHIRIPKNCWELNRGGANCDGAYIIYPMGVKAVRVYCDMTNGGWTVILKRGDYGNLRHSFDQNWQSYKIGFGDVNGEYWFGNENLQLLSGQESLELKVDLTSSDGTSISFAYSRFSVGSESSNYRLHLGSPVQGPHAKLANYFRHHSAHPFSTYDRNHRRGNCPVGPDRGGWWHLCNSGYVRLTEPDMTWYTWNPDIRYAVMKVRPATQL